MATDYSIITENDPDPTEGKYCPGSFKKAVKKGGTYTNQGFRYRCPDCKKYYTKDGQGFLTKHGYKQVPATKKIVSFCAKCKKKFDSETLDYLCPKCRGAK